MGTGFGVELDFPNQRVINCYDFCDDGVFANGFDLACFQPVITHHRDVSFDNFSDVIDAKVAVGLRLSPLAALAFAIALHVMAHHAL